MIEALLTKIASIIFKKALFGSFFEAISTAYEIYSIIDTVSDLAFCVDTTNDCYDLGISGIQVISNPLSELVFNQFVEIGNHKYSVEKTTSGIYIASNLVPTFSVKNYDFPTGVFKGSKGDFNTGGSSRFSTGGKGSFNSGSKNF